MNAPILQWKTQRRCLQRKSIDRSSADDTYMGRKFYIMLDRFRKRFISFVTAAVMTISCGSPVFAEESDISEAEPETAASELRARPSLHI